MKRETIFGVRKYVSGKAQIHITLKCDDTKTLDSLYYTTSSSPEELYELLGTMLSTKYSVNIRHKIKSCVF